MQDQNVQKIVHELETEMKWICTIQVTIIKKYRIELYMRLSPVSAPLVTWSSTNPFQKGDIVKFQCLNILEHCYILLPSNHANIYSSDSVYSSRGDSLQMY